MAYMVKPYKIIIGILATLFFFGLASSAEAAITFDASSTKLVNGFRTGTVVATTSLTVGSVNPNPILVMCADVWQDVGGVGAVTGASWKGVALTKVVTSTRSTSMAVECWYLLNPSTGVGVASATFTGATDEIKYIWSVFDGVDQTSPIDATSTNTGAVANATTTITTKSDNAMLFESISLFGTATMTQHTGSTLIWKDNTNATDGGATYKLVPATGSANMGWTWSGNNDWAEAVVSLKAAVSTPSTPLPSNAAAFINGVTVTIPTGLMVII